MTAPNPPFTSVHLPLQKDLSLANRLIALMPADDRAIFLEHSEMIELKVQTVLTRSGENSDHAYFPVDSVVATLLPGNSADGLEIGLIGNEGMVNTSLVLGVRDCAFTSVVQGAGRSFKIHRRSLQKLLAGDSCLRIVLNRYIDVRMSHLAQQVACKNSHTVEQRLARWLLMTRDRAHANELFLTHEVLARMLGVRRESISQSARSLQRHGLISYTRGYVMLMDAAALEQVACACYRSDLAVYERTLRQPREINGQMSAQDAGKALL
ncbi:Crp/Fnr family transcriptional regulator [Polaromonas eurypsychrophila]|uniref:Crp/Fnr family transcriptional regulator n=1 Tax=Polaromonas eurypsychrophila TaxID=1614635 RepID=A0A916SBR5_9BURK|nr:Crp/Fnr family transcriptional regulator [Polaromonas eurypsychrophila]GGA90312.1 Crp/Fnr family transcriptional regulator [Polaromonas eurypsychrophila]